MITDTFSPGAARALDGPDWLRTRRAEAAERYASTPLPTAELEDWRYSRVGELDLARYRLVGAEPVSLPSVLDTTAAFGRVSASVVVHNGHVLGTHVDHDVAERGVYVGSLHSRADAEKLLDSLHVDAVDAFAELNNAFAADPLLIIVPRGVELAEPIVIVHRIDASGAAIFPRLVVVLGENASATVVEQRSSSTDALLVPTTELHVGRDARLGYLDLQQLGPQTFQIGSQLANVEAGATITSSTAAFGGDYARQRTDCRLIGRGATGNLVSLYFGDGEQMLDFRTFQDHAAPDTTSNLLFKGAVDDHSKSVYTGLIRVRPNARGTNAFQTNRNIKLAEGAWAESVPNLEIENNDVRCSHASTVGPIDADQEFYLESRGVPPEVAERLVIAGFFAEVIERLPSALAAPLVQAAISQKLATVSV
jgi:Fe-S cluster assembly protein SufD